VSEAWITTTNLVSTNNGKYQITVNPRDRARFYRLVQP
jgi:hypothetical protein